MTVIPAVSGVQAPQIGNGWVTELPLVAPSVWSAYPTGLSAATISRGGTASQQTQQLYTLLRQASNLVDNEILGVGQQAGGMFSVRAGTYCESDTVNVIGQEIRLSCRVRPVLTLTNVGYASGTTIIPITPTTNSGIWISRRTIHVPVAPMSFSSLLLSGTTPAYFYPSLMAGTTMLAIWTYTAGYFHTALADNIAAGATTIPVAPNSADGLVAV